MQFNDIDRNQCRTNKYSTSLINCFRSYANKKRFKYHLPPVSKYNLSNTTFTLIDPTRAYACDMLELCNAAHFRNQAYISHTSFRIPIVCVRQNMKCHKSSVHQHFGATENPKIHTHTPTPTDSVQYACTIKRTQKKDIHVPNTYLATVGSAHHHNIIIVVASACEHGATTTMVRHGALGTVCVSVCVLMYTFDGRRGQMLID